MQFSYAANPVRAKSNVMLKTKSKSYLPLKGTPFAQKSAETVLQEKRLTSVDCYQGMDVCAKRGLEVEEWGTKDPGLWFWKDLATPLYLVVYYLSKSAIS